MSEKSNTLRGLLISVAVLAVLLAVLIGAAVPQPDPSQPSEPTYSRHPSVTTVPSFGPSTEPATESTVPTTVPTETTVPTVPTTVPAEPTAPTVPTTVPEETTAPTEPPITAVGTATIANVGDMLMHLPVINAAKQNGDTYDFSRMFAYFQAYVEAADFAVANLETTLAGKDNGYKYSGYPRFNCPDGIAHSLKNVGFDMLLTANNHSFDTRETGFFRTQQVLAEAGLAYLGTTVSEEIPLWQVREINGVSIGMVCYTYETRSKNHPDTPGLNGIQLSEKAAALVGRFQYTDLDAFYQEMAANITAMEEAGAEAIVLYIHWGKEYQTRENDTQNLIAQNMCDLGVDVIVGGHPHVVQPMELLTSRDGSGHKTVCLYSMGNCLSNQNRVNMNLKTGHTEDGALFQFSFTKYSDGTVILSAVDILPLWVNRSSGSYRYNILPLDNQLPDWQLQFGLSDSKLQKARESYDRTMAIVGDGLVQVQAYLAQHVADTEARLGIDTE